MSNIALTKDFWFERADSFRIFGFRKISDGTDVPHFSVSIKKCHQKDGSIKYGVFLEDEKNALSKSCIDDYFLSQQEEAYFFVLQSMPSSRTQEELDDTRFNTVDEAYAAFQRIKVPFLNNYVIEGYRDSSKFEVIE